MNSHIDHAIVSIPFPAARSGGNPSACPEPRRRTRVRCSAQRRTRHARITEEKSGPSDPELIATRLFRPPFTVPPPRSELCSGIQEVLRSRRRLVQLEISWTRDQLMAVSQDRARDQGRILELSWPERQVDAFGDVVHEPVGDEDLHAHIGVGRLECAYPGSSQGPRMAQKTFCSLGHHSTKPSVRRFDLTILYETSRDAELKGLGAVDDHPAIQQVWAAQNPGANDNKVSTLDGSLGVFYGSTFGRDVLARTCGSRPGLVSVSTLSGRPIEVSQDFYPPH